jgi:Ran GTPase-activating protein (RanGAP) involved in mRNA processing and transport
MTSRKLNEIEKKLIVNMPVPSPYDSMIKEKINDLLVEEMNDGQMGSLYFLSNNRREDRRLGIVISEIETMDSDKVPVSISLNCDNFGDIYELDIWKVDFSLLKDLKECVESFLCCRSDDS